eukprot:4468747-Pleurochrysis_carterae.AAC.1
MVMVHADGDGCYAHTLVPQAAAHPCGLASFKAKADGHTDWRLKMCASGRKRQQAHLVDLPSFRQEEQIVKHAKDGRPRLVDRHDHCATLRCQRLQRLDHLLRLRCATPYATECVKDCKRQHLRATHDGTCELTAPSNCPRRRLQTAHDGASEARSHPPEMSQALR